MACARTVGRSFGKVMKLFLAIVLVSCVGNCLRAKADLSVDKQVSTHQSSASAKLVSPAFSTTGSNELLLAFLTSDGPAAGSQSFASVTGAGLTWRLRQRTNARGGTAEIWQAVATGPLSNVTVTAARSSGSYVGSLTVVAFTGASTTTDGAVASANSSSGAPTATLTTTRAGSWVWGVGDDWDNAIARTVGANQTKVDEFLASTGDTFWVQRQNSPTAVSGTAVTINDTAPTADRWNLSLIEVTSATVDTTPPTPPSNLTANAISPNQVSLSWSASTDNVGVTGYNILRNGSQIGTSTALTYNDNTAAASTTYSYTVTAQDAAGNISGPSNTATVITPSAPPDTTPPTVSLTAPADKATVSGTVSVSANASDNVGVAGVQFLLNGNPLGTEESTPPYSLNWDTTTVVNGPYTLSARGRDAAGNVTTSATRTVTVNNFSTDPTQVGQWSSVMSWPLVAINMALLNNGKVLMWDGGPNCLGAITDYVWDPATNTFTQVNLENQPEVRDIFCSGQTVLADGRVLVTGGHDCTSATFVGTSIANMFDPVTNQWTFLPDMNYRRWYPTATTLPDGRALVTAGSDTSVTAYIPIPEIYDPVANTWSQLTSANQTIPNYSFMFVLPDGRVLAAGSDEAKMGTYALNVATQTWSVVDPTVLDAGSAVMYLPGKVMKAGSSYLSPPADNGGNIPSAATTYLLDMTQGSPAWRQTPSMAYPRTHLNLSVLPDGAVLATGGSSVIGGIDPTTGVLAAELWNPATQAWTTMASEQRSRMYHSTAVLLPDGRVLVAGSGHNFANNYAETTAEIYSPPYLFKGARPTLTSTPSTLAYGAEFYVATPDAANIASVSLIRNGAVTHAFNMDQRYVPLTFRVVAGGLMVTAPGDANTAPPGYYMLFATNSNGVPSIAPFVHLPVPTTQPIRLIQHAANGFENSVSQISLTFPSNVTAGNFLIVTGTAARPAETITISDSAGNTYIPAIGPVTDPAQNVTAYVWYVVNARGGPNTITLTPTGGPDAMEIHVSEWSGIDNISPLDQTASATGNGTQISSGAKTTSQDGELIFGYTFPNQNSTAGTGFTGISLVNGDLDEFQIQPTAGSIAATFTQLSDNWFALMATFRPASLRNQPPVYTISGVVATSTGTPVSGATVSTNGVSATTAADGTYTLSGLLAGTYSVSASATGYTLNGPFSATVGPNQAGLNFLATAATGSSGLAVDRMVTVHQSAAAKTIVSPALSTTSSNELLLAFIASDGPSSGKQTISSVTGGGLTWRLRQRTNTQAGTAEIWQAVATAPLTSVTITATRGSGSYVGSMTVVAFTGASTTADGATASASGASGAPSGTLTTTRAGSWVWGVGDDWDNAIARTVGANQTKVDEFLTSTGDTFWVQRQNNPTPTAGTSVTLSDTAPTADRWNFSLIEILPQ